MNMVNIFTIPMWEFDIQYNKENVIKRLLEVKESVNDTKYYTNGYQSSGDSLRDIEELYPLFYNVIETANKASMDSMFVPHKCFINSGWVNISESRSSFIQNANSTDTFTAIFFAKVSENCGNFSINNPCFHNTKWVGEDICLEKTMMTSKRMNIKPQEGQLILFPSYLSYNLEPSLDDETNISVVLNIVVVPDDGTDS